MPTTTPTPQSDRRASVIWGMIVGGSIAYELATIHSKTLRSNGHLPLSAVCAALCRTETRGGRAAFGCLWALLTWWFIPHVWTYVIERKISAVRADDVEDHRYLNAQHLHDAAERRHEGED